MADPSGRDMIIDHESLDESTSTMSLSESVGSAPEKLGEVPMLPTDENIDMSDKSSSRQSLSEDAGKQSEILAGAAATHSITPRESVQVEAFDVEDDKPDKGGIAWKWPAIILGLLCLILLIIMIVLLTLPRTITCFPHDARYFVQLVPN